MVLLRQHPGMKLKNVVANECFALALPRSDDPLVKICFSCMPGCCFGSCGPF